MELRAAPPARFGFPALPYRGGAGTGPGRAPVTFGEIGERGEHAQEAEIAKREVVPDPLYQSGLATKFINSVMRQGKKSVAERIFYGAMELIRERTKDDPLKIFKKAVDNVKPLLEVKSRRVGGSTYQVPVEVRPARRSSLAFRWLISFAKARAEKSMAERLANELLDAANNRGAAVKKKEEHAQDGRGQQGLRPLSLVRGRGLPWIP